MSTVNQERELGWDDQIEKESEFILLPEGEYDFYIHSFERARHSGSEKLPACNKAIVNVIIMSPDGNEVSIKHNLFLHTKCEGLLSAFFIAIGQKKHGEPLKMNWSAVPASTGRCKVGIHNWTSNKTGEKMQSNQITKFIEPSGDDMHQVPQGTFAEASTF